MASAFLGGQVEKLRAVGVRRVTFMVYLSSDMTELPCIFTFRLRNDFGRLNGWMDE